MQKCAIIAASYAIHPTQMSILNNAADTQPEHAIITTTRQWLEKAVIGLNLCPFAKAVYVKNQIRYAVSDATTMEELHADLISELDLLCRTSSQEIDTTLLIHPWVLGDFLDYNDFLGIVDETVETVGLGGEIQVASFHPQYQFADAGQDDIENYTNRSPYPTLHLLREASIDRAVDSFSEAAEIFSRNMETMRSLGRQGWNDMRLGPANPPNPSGDKN